MIARQRVADLEPELAQALTAQGLKLRNDDAQVGELRLQDLLKDDLARLLIGLVRLGATRGGQPQTWREVTSTLTRVVPNDRNREMGSSTDDALSHFLAELRSWFAATPLNNASTGPVFDFPEELIDTLVDKLTTFVNYDNLTRSASSQTGRKTWR